jgi:hypothetical protein
MGEARRKRLAAELERKVRADFDAAAPGLAKASKVFAKSTISATRPRSV